MAVSLKTILINVFVCTLFMSFPLFLYPHPPELETFYFTKPSIRDFIANFLMIVFFYLNYHFFLPKFYFQKKEKQYYVLVFLFLIVLCSLPSFLANYFAFDQHLTPLKTPFKHLQKPNDMLFIQHIAHHIFLFLAIVFFSLSIRTQKKWFNSEKARKDAEIISLKAQINPHFLFNALNSIYALSIIENAPKTSDGILKLSSMMRYVVTETSQHFVSIKNELEYINNYIELQKLRLDKNVELIFNLDAKDNNKFIAPMILIPFIENAFKHGVNPDENSFIKIAILVDEKRIKLEAINKKVKVSYQLEENLGHGLHNTINRLESIYGKNYELKINDVDEFFIINLEITII